MRTELVTTLKRRATEILSELENEKAPILITQYGKPAAYLVDVETYDDLQRQLNILRGIARGERAVEEGRTVRYHRVAKDANWRESVLPMFHHYFLTLSIPRLRPFITMRASI